MQKKYSYRSKSVENVNACRTFNVCIFLIKCLLRILVGQKWKKASGPSPRKFKEPLTNTNILANNTDKYGNKDNNANDVNKNNFQWKEETL